MAFIFLIGNYIFLLNFMMSGEMLFQTGETIIFLLLRKIIISLSEKRVE